jgi:hypothetical protein
MSALVTAEIDNEKTIPSANTLALANAPTFCLREIYKSCP